MTDSERALTKRALAAEIDLRATKLLLLQAHTTIARHESVKAQREHAALTAELKALDEHVGNVTPIKPRARVQADGSLVEVGHR